MSALFGRKTRIFGTRGHTHGEDSTIDIMFLTATKVDVKVDTGTLAQAATLNNDSFDSLALATVCIDQ